MQVSVWSHDVVRARCRSGGLPQWRLRGLFARGVLLVIGCMVAIGASSCSKRRESSPTETAMPVVPAPQGLVAEFVVRTPQASWDAVRTELGLNAALLPRSLPVFLVSTLALPTALADEFDLTAPLYGAADSVGESVGFAVAIHARNGAGIAQRLERVVASDAQPAQPFAVSVTDDYLVIANGSRAMSALAPYVARALPVRMSTRHDASVVLPRAALSGPILATLRQGWESWKREREADDAALRAQHGGSAPDFGDPAQALSDLEGKASRLFGVLADLDELRVDADLESAAHLARVALSYRPLSATGPAAEEIAAMDTGDADPILSLPQASLVTLFWRESAESRQRSADQQLDSLTKVLGERLGRPERAKVESAIRTWSEGRGDWLGAGALWSESVRTVVVRSAVADIESMRKAPERLLELLSIPAIAAPLSAWVGELKVSPIVTAQGKDQPEVRSVRVTRRPRKAQTHKPNEPAPEPLDIAWQIDENAFVAAAGQGAKQAMAAVLPASTEPKLRDTPEIAAAVRHLGTKISFLAVAEPARIFGALGTVGAERLAPILLAYGKSHAELGGHARGWLELQCPIPVILELAAQRMRRPALQPGSAAAPSVPVTPRATPPGQAAHP